MLLCKKLVHATLIVTGWLDTLRVKADEQASFSD